MKNSRNEPMQRFNNTTGVRVTPVKPKEVMVSMDSIPATLDQIKVTDEETEKKATQTVYAKLKQAACCRDQDRAEDRWKKIEELFLRPQYHGDKKKILEKLDDENNYAPIHYAVRSNNLYVCQKLLDSKCNVNLLGWESQTPLHLAACSSKIEEELSLEGNKKISILFLLLNQRGIRINISDDKGRTPLHHAIMRKHTNIAHILLDNGAKPEMADIQGATAIHYAYRYGKDSQLHSRLFPYKGLLQMKTVDNKTPFETAAEYGNLDAVRKYLVDDQTSSPNSKFDIRAFIPGAVRHRNMEFLTSFRSTADISRLVLQLACEQPNGEELIMHQNIKRLFNKDVMKGRISDDGFTPLMIAVKHTRDKCVEELLKPEYCDEKILEIRSSNFERTVLHICAEYSHNKTTDLLLQAVTSCRLNLAPVDVMGNTPLHICAQKNNIYMCDKLLSLCKTISSSTEISKSNPNRQTAGVGILPDMLKIQNNNGLTAFHEAIENGHYEIFERMIKAVDNPTDLIEQHDDQLRTSLHTAALKGNAQMVVLLLQYEADVQACDINDHTPLHEAARWSDSLDEGNQHRVACMEHLIKANAQVNALNIYQESPLHIACRYGASSFVKCLLKYGADLLKTNAHGYNCLEVAIEEKNEEIVKYLIGHDYVFELLRNAQLYEEHRELCQTCGDKSDRGSCCVPCCKYFNKCSFYSCCLGLDRHKADTPMRKLIVSMPDMALEVLDKCTTTIGSEKSQIHRQFFSYEFLEDQYAVRNWYKGNRHNDSHLPGKTSLKYEDIDKDKPYTRDYKTLVLNHPLFLMAVYDRYKLMHHPISKSLVNQKFYGISIILFVLSFALYGTFLGIYTTIVLRTQHPQYYYNLTGFDYDSTLCRNVTQALGNSAVKQTADIVFKNTMYVFFALIVAKNVWAIVGYIRIDWSKIFTFLLEIISIVLNFYFVFDYDYQTKYTMRCPLQWQIGAFGLLTGYIALFYYIQYIPVFGIYVIMIRQILIRFLLFLPVFMVLICAFGLTLFMIFQNFDAFGNVAFSLVKIVMMSTGEITYDDLMNSDKTTAYYKVGYILLILFVVIITILVSNLLIGLAVGEIGPMMNAAKDTRIDMFYELAADFEILKFQIISLFSRCCTHRCFISPSHYKQNDLTKQWKWYRNLKKRLLVSCAREVDKDNLSESDDDEQSDYPKHLLEEVRKGIQKLQPQSHNARLNSALPNAGRSNVVVGLKRTNKK